jgi:3-methyl-2-oxobutanoate hydroxymethyltransferase
MSYGNTEEPKAIQKKISTLSLQKLKQNKEKFVTVALYDAPMATMAEQSGVEVLLVGDSLGMTVLGFDSTIPVTMEQMIYHIEAVSRGSKNCLIMGDLPFMTYATPEQAMLNASRVMQAGAHMVKIEGGEWLCDTVSKLSDRGIPVCAHIGLTPQSVNKFGGFRVQGRDEKRARQLIHDAKLLERAGADILLMECVPSELAKTITETLTIPTIGIGAGPDTDAQVLVINDILGLTAQPPKFSKNFLVESKDIPAAMQKYVMDVKSGIFPAKEHTFT